MRLMALAALALALAGVGRAAAAQGTSFWQEVAHPGVAQAEPLRQNLRALLSTRADRSMLALGLSIADRALRLAPADPELGLIRARLLYDLDRFEEAAGQLEAVIEAHPSGVFAPEAAMVLGVTLTRLDRYAEAGQAYRRFLAEEVWPTRRAIALTNLAETQMALGELEPAHASFREALTNDPEYTLGYFGLAVVLDRLGEQGGALDAMLHGLSVGLGFAELASPDVFYVPAWEIHYYLALAHEAQGQQERARLEWQAFLDGGGAGGPFAATVRAHLAELSRRSP